MIEKIPIISFMVFAIWYTMQEGEIFERLGFWLEKHLPDKIHNPVYECPVCMVPWYGSVIYWLIWGKSYSILTQESGQIFYSLPLWLVIKDWVIVVLAAMGLNVVLNKLFPPDEIEIEPDFGPDRKEPEVFKLEQKNKPDSDSFDEIWMK